VDSLIARADRAMYQAKHGGKARVTIAPPAGGGD
jgi:PleD family two-component response regulator